MIFRPDVFVPLDNISLQMLAKGFERGNGEGMSEVLGQLAQHPAFQLLKEHDLLREYLIAFLELDKEAYMVDKQIRNMSFLSKLRYGKDKKKSLADIVSAREEAWKKYEMLRRLVCFDNLSLKAHKTRLESL